MKIHFIQVRWALKVLWNLKQIWFVDRLRLWRKSLNLYLSFLAFTDEKRPSEQLRRAMVCALISAVYDYDTDNKFGDRSGKNCFDLLDRYVGPRPAEIAKDLLNKDSKDDLSQDGLERGSVAFRFYSLVIDPEWLRQYSELKIDLFGRRLQIIDDLIDLERDFVAGDKNCFLLTGRADKFAQEAKDFMASHFFRKLKANSSVYRGIERKAEKALLRFGSERPTFKQLFKTTRPTTILYAFLLVIAGFRFYESWGWIVESLIGFAFAGLTASIMVWNDFTDREHDRKKGKTFASENAGELLFFWKLINVATIVLIILVGVVDVRTALFCGLIWGLGILCSLIPRRVIIQNLIVAVCSGSPALVGMIFNRQFNQSSLLTFLIFTSLIFINEIYKDIEDQNIDKGHKETLPVRFGYLQTYFFLIIILMAPAIFIIIHPNPWVVTIGWLLLPYLAFRQSFIMLHPERIAGPKSAMRLMLKCLLVVLLFT